MQNSHVANEVNLKTSQIRLADDSIAYACEIFNGLDAQQGKILLSALGFLIHSKHHSQFVDRSQGITQSILRYSKPSKKDTCDFKDVIGDCLNFISIRMRDHGINLTKSIDVSPLLKMNGSDLHQILLNIFLNACDALEEGTDKPEIKIQTELDQRKKPRLRVLISNNGPKIKESMRNQLFSRGVTSKGSHGSGIGLYMSKQLIERYEGSIDLLDDGRTTFEILIPINT